MSKSYKDLVDRIAALYSNRISSLGREVFECLESHSDDYLEENLIMAERVAARDLMYLQSEEMVAILKRKLIILGDKS